MRFSPIRLLAAASVIVTVGLLGTAQDAIAADVNDPPIRTIANPSGTVLHLPFGVAIAPDGTTYVLSATGPAILVYAPGATGTDAPSRIITGGNTGITSDAFGLALDSAGNMYVTNQMGGPTVFTGNIVELPASATGNATPTRVISGAATNLSDPEGIAIAADGTIYVAQTGSGPAEVVAFASTSSGNVAPVKTISGSATGLAHPAGVALQNDGSIVVSDNIQNSISTFAATASGNVAPLFNIAGSNSQLSNVINIALDHAGNIYAANNVGSSITEYPANATGNVTPRNRIVGSGTGLSQPVGIGLDAQGEIFASNNNADSITVYNPFLTVSGVSSASGTSAGGSTVTITGNGFVAGAAVTFGGIPATDVTVTSLTTLTAVTPAHAVGRADVSVTEGTQLATLATAFTFVDLLAATGTNVAPLVGIALALILLGLLAIGAVALSRATRRRATRSS